MRFAAPLLFVGITLALGGLSSTLIGHPISDTIDHLWSHEWVVSELLSGRVPLKTHTTHYPQGGWLWQIDPIGSLLYIPLRLMGAVLAWNFMLIIQICRT